LFVRSFIAVAVAAAFSFGAAASAYAAPDMGKGDASANWAGVAKTGHTYEWVQATYTEPSMPVPCEFGTSGPSLALVRVGFDGFGNGTSEQVGTGIECIPAGKPNGPTTPMVVKHAGFFQVDPGANPLGTVFCNPEDDAPAKGCVGSFDLLAGDTVTASVSFADGTFTFSLFNERTGETATATGTSAAATRTSAEAVVEAPFGTHVPLTNFESIGFEGFVAHAENHEGGQKSDNQAITMKNGATVRAEPGDLHGSTFTVTWDHA